MVLLLASLFAAGCGTSVPPSDGEMIRLFRTHEAAFNHVYEIISEKTEGSHYYPPSEFDSIFIRELAPPRAAPADFRGFTGRIPRICTGCSLRTGRCSILCWR